MVVEIISIILSSLLSAISIGIAIFAYKQGTKQIEISNKQSLFKDRVKAYELLNGFVEVYEQNKEIVSDSETIPAFPFHLLCSNNFLSEAIEVIDKPLCNKEQNVFLSKMEDLRTLALEVSMLWECEESNIARDFLYTYMLILTSLYRQHVFICKLEASPNKVSLEEFKEKTKIMADHTELHKNIKMISQTYEQIKEKEVLKVLKERIKLK